MATQVIMPQMGESVVEGTVGKWLKQVGDSIEVYEPLVEVETDKVTSEVTASISGTLLRIYTAEGQTVPAGTVLAVIGQPGESVPDAPEAQAVAAFGHPAAGARASAAVPVLENAAPARTSTAHMTPVVARIAAEHQVDVSKVKGTGHGGRVTKKDIMDFIERGGTQTAVQEPPPWEQPGSGDLFKPTDDLYRKTAPAPLPAPVSAPSPALSSASAAPSDHTHKAPPSPGQPGDLIPLSTMRRRIAEHMVRSKLQTAPHVTTVFEVDMNAVVGHREAHKEEFTQRGINLTFTAYFMAAAAEALRRHPMVNSQWTDEGIRLHREVNIGMAVALDEGLIVPVVKHADELSLPGLSRQINDLAQRARAGALKPDEVQGGTFTITNHGVAGSLFATPIINQPQSGILGVGAIKKRVVVLPSDAIAIRPMVYLSLTFDHRVLDGASADWFVAEMVKLLENWQ